MRREASDLAAELTPTLSTGGTAVLVDLEPTLGVWLAAEFSSRRLASVVLLLPRWPHDHAVLPTSELTDTLIAAARWLAPSDKAPNVVFVLDAERSQSIPRRPATDSRADNRYSLSPAELPNLATLRRADIRRVLRLTRG